METATKDRNPETRSEVLSSASERKPIYVFRYDKISGEFECDEWDKSHIDQSVLFYMSKLNAILFNYQNTENNHSLIAMLKVYFPHFLLVFLLIGVLFAVVFTGFIEEIFEAEHGSASS